MAGYRIYILTIIILAVLAVVFLALPDRFFTLPDSRPTTSDTFVKCSACHQQQYDELKRAAFHTTKQCTDCHRLSEFKQDLRSHTATTRACAECHAKLPRMENKKPLDHTSFNLVYEHQLLLQ